MQKLPTTKSLRLVYPALTASTASLCRDVMRGSLDPLTQPLWFPRTHELYRTEFIPTSPRLLRMLALAELTNVYPDNSPDAPAMARYGVQCRLDDTFANPTLLWLHSAGSPDTLTLCCLAPPPPPLRRAVQRDPWLYRDHQTHDTYKLAIPARLIAAQRRKAARS